MKKIISLFSFLLLGFFAMAQNKTESVKAKGQAAQKAVKENTAVKPVLKVAAGLGDLAIEGDVGEQPKAVKPKDTEGELFSIYDPRLERKAQFPGGEQKFNAYVSQNLKYPKEAKEYNVQGRVFVSFIVEKDGSLSNITVPRGLDRGCDEEAIRLVKSSGKWEPASSGGKVVRSQQNVAVKFVLE